ncbi:hypothetical protein L3X38_018540 [Prunus dulcis]|uniref:Uncharacterized protein n=1 Tax=Prunus dulcis TaxID=3755 RepID=A0AAD4WA72_PRUDU|nr:hypothetical protein L3X38_018540 [Prunus dulcis]
MQTSPTAPKPSTVTPRVSQSAGANLVMNSTKDNPVAVLDSGMQVITCVSNVTDPVVSAGEGESPSLVVFRCGTPLALLRVVICGDASLAKARGCRRPKACMSQGDVARNGGAEGNVPRHEGAEGPQLACRKAMWLGTRVPKARGYRMPKACMSQGNVARHEGAEGPKLACRKAMWLGTRVPKAQGCRRPKACMSQGNVARHEGAEGNVARHGGAEGPKLACRKAMWLGGWASVRYRRRGLNFVALSGVLSSIDSALALPFGKADWRAFFVSSRLRWVSLFKFNRVLPFGRIKCRQRGLHPVDKLPFFTISTFWQGTSGINLFVGDPRRSTRELEPRLLLCRRKTHFRGARHLPKLSAAKPNLQDTCRHHNGLHKVSHRNFVQSSHFHLPINREQFPGKTKNYSPTFTVTLPELLPVTDLGIGEPSAGTTPVSEA